MEDKVEVIAFESRYAKDFASLNIEWLEKYFVVEPHDAELLQKCEETIIAKGGYIFFARIGNAIVGTFSLIKVADGVYELGKMAVSPKFQGRKIGQVLMEFCIAYAKEQGWRKILLYSNRILKNAIHIYEKYGFKEVHLEEDSPYQRSNIKMKLSLS
ncbi:MAG: GNAT family N-acetyltransferase [Cellulophaga sp.]